MNDKNISKSAKHPNFKRTNGGYTLPLVLFSIAGVTILVTSSYRTILSRDLVGRNLVNAEIVDDSAESFIEIYKGLLNSNTHQALNYFWLSQSCSPSISQANCPADYSNNTKLQANGIKLPTSVYFQDDGESWESYCHAYSPSGQDTTSLNCLGRKAAPVCSVHSRNSSSFTIPWPIYKQSIDKFSSLFQLYPKHQALNNKSIPYGLIYKKTQVGSPELGGESWLDIKSLTINKNSTRPVQASKSFRLRFSIDKFIDSSKFAYLSAGSYHSSLAPYSLTNLKIGSGSRSPVRGVILLRRSLSNNFDCRESTIHDIFNINDQILTSTLPLRGDGGLAIHAVKFPTVPNSSSKNPSTMNLQRYVVRGSKIIRTNRQERIINVENLFLTRDSTLYIETSSKYPVNLIVNDSLDIAPGARICNIEVGKSLDSCGSGNPVNLLIKGNPINWKKQSVDSSYRFVDSTTTPPDPSRGRFYPFTDSEAFCSTGRGGFGELISANTNTSVISPRPKSQKPGPSFSFSSTGGKSDVLSAFIVGKYVSFNAPAVSTLAPLIQAPFFEDSSGYQLFNSSPFLATHRGRLVAVNIQPYKSVNNKLVKACNTDNCIYTLLSPPDYRYKPFSRITLNNIDPHRTTTPYFSASPDARSLDSTFILAVASSNNSSSSAPNIWVSYNWKTKEYKINPFTVSNERSNRNWLGSYEDASYILLDHSPVLSISHKGVTIPTTFKNTHPNFSLVLDFLAQDYQIKLTAPSISPYIKDRQANKSSLSISQHRRYKGAIWTKNICFSIDKRINRERFHDFIFPASFSNDLSNRFKNKYPNHDLDYGMRSYKYTYTSNWDSTRGF